MSENIDDYPGQNERGIKSSYRGFLDISSDIISTTISSTDTVNNLDAIWFRHFLKEIKSLFNQETYVEIRNKANEEQFRFTNYFQKFWQKIIREHKKENLAPTLAPTVAPYSDETSENETSEVLQLDSNKTNKNTEKITFQVKQVKDDNTDNTDIEEHSSNEYWKKQNNNLAPFVTFYSNETSAIKLSEVSQSNSNKTNKYTEKITQQKGKLKRVRDDNADTENLSNEYWKKQNQILRQNKNNLVYRHVVDDALLIASAYETNEPVLQAIVEKLIPLKYCIPELLLVMNGKKPKGSGRFGYSDIFILSNEGNNNIILELKYISLIGLINSNQKNNFGANELENLDKILENENEESVLKRSYTYWSKNDKKTNLITIGETLNNGLNQLNSYMKTISKGKAINYSSSGVFDERVKITKSKPNKLKGFVILVIGFRRILWKSANEVTTNYIYNKI
ncbi:hypothetical protein GLOIN_2v1779809 [Rhizophagus irregularis DAOM 181602=DAOM 197198]|uniref:Uncharacterized protein n=1 Tax=Rhizophagus irregularis (strain DAOM 181602 / DAOM 197198 / MUCL 43194) TaxID=747089 RepID=A0A2P4PNT8_RHIID|nr:hypothetical protein GLOIN_2v1779809 [Rhizophagus irregularis DAOM 181602=DAOM 197198]POG67058.1 hypothetical protein GLOIN_2v1779809 [Rhizophagus irregularis DAOM 181602=DAOM 197198]|eukprot:XP_025173924.1 hypothetical protein GLOIN_2v1779809 [Rhizophagus irregularis DAOM 181602=DAOM 197198]